MYGDLDKLEENKKKLNAISPSFCMAKWMQVSIDLGAGLTHSCYLPQRHKIPLEELRENPSALHNTKYKKQRRKEMLEGTRPQECGICWAIEDLPGNQVSDRHLRSVESWTMPYMDKVKSMPWDQNINPSYMEVSFNNVCNFKCSYCSPHASTKWMEEIRQHGPYQLSGGSHQDLDYFRDNDLLSSKEDENPYIQAFWEWWPTAVQDLVYFRITGGEPLISKHTFRVLEWLNENPQPHLGLCLNSNLGMPQAQIERAITLLIPLVREKKIRDVFFHTSVDTWGRQAEYIRHGLKFEEYQQNIELILQKIPGVSLAFMCTFNNLSLANFRPFLQWILQLRRRHTGILLDLPHLQAPEHQSLRILTPDFLEMLDGHIQWMQARVRERIGFKEAEFEKMRRVREWMAQPMDQTQLTALRKDFYLFFSEHDRRRGTNFLEVFPQMKDFWNLCRDLAQT